MRRLLAPVAILGLLISAAACAQTKTAPLEDARKIPAGSVSENAARFTATDYKYQSTVASVATGRVDILLRNDGTVPHEAVLVRVEGDRFGAPVAEVEAIPAGESGALRVDLRAGRYKLICLLLLKKDGLPVSHWSEGMEVDLEVTAS